MRPLRHWDKPTTPNYLRLQDELSIADYLDRDFAGRRNPVHLQNADVVFYHPDDGSDLLPCKLNYVVTGTPQAIDSTLRDNRRAELTRLREYHAPRTQRAVAYREMHRVIRDYLNEHPFHNAPLAVYFGAVPEWAQPPQKRAA